MIESLLLEKEISYQRISKKEGIKISQEWLRHFASNVKEQTGKYLAGKYKWEAYWANIEPALSGSEALNKYREGDTEDYYIIDENGKEVYFCTASEWPNFFEDYIDIYVVPKSLTWSMAFSHEGTCHYAGSNI